MNNDERTRVLRGLVEHDGRWIPIGDKIKLLESKQIQPSSLIEKAEPGKTKEDAIHDFEENPLSAHETAAVARFADALKGEETDRWSISKSNLRNAIIEAKTVELEEADAAFDRYQKAQSKKKMIIYLALVGFIAAAVILLLLNR